MIVEKRSIGAAQVETVEAVVPFVVADLEVFAGDVLIDDLDRIRFVPSDHDGAFAEGVILAFVGSGHDKE